jgi:SRSO17 transposase
LIIDETGFLKKGAKPCGVARQYVGAAGDTVNAQVGVFLAYASQKGVAFIDRALYLPRAWTDDPARRPEAGIPPEMRFASKIELAKRLLARAFEAGVPAQ